jgi:DNA modification methylase
MAQAGTTASRLLSDNMAQKRSKTSAKRKAELQEQPPLAASVRQAQPTAVDVTAAKGRPMLTWVGKRPLIHVTAFPAQLVERHLAQDILGLAGNDPDVYDKRMEMFRNLRDHWNADCWEDLPNHVAAPESGGLLLHGDNKECLAWLLANGYRGKVDLVYIDPPFDSGADYVRKINLRGVQGGTKLDGESYTLGEQIQYTDIWANDNYLQFMYERLLLLRELLSESGSLALHCDVRRSHYLRLLLEEVFGADNLRGEIVVKAGVKNVQSQFEEMSSLTLGHNSIFLFSKGKDTKYRTLKTIAEEYEPGKWDTFWRGTNRPTMRYELFGQSPKSGQWRWQKNRAEQAIENYKKYRGTAEGSLSLDDYYLREFANESDLDFVRLSEDGVVQYYVPPRKYKVLSNVWLDLPYRGTQTDYPTEKNEAIAARLAEWLTGPGALIIDSFAGSGTVAAVAQKMGRRWIACDVNKGAIQTTVKRLRGIVSQQIDAAMSARRDNAGRLIAEPDGDEPKPCQFGFHVLRVNDYDLQIQHNEAVNLACEHIGVQRTRSDRFFDGTRGTKLVKIVPFDHPLSPVDLEEVRRELEARPDEDRGVIMVSLGIEVAARTWIDDWNRRRGKAVNKIEVIELRTDAKYGRFIQHQSAKARVKIARSKDRIIVEIQDFVSPTIVERLQQQAGVVSPKIDDWRAMVDCVMVDTAYDGDIFNVVVADIPEKKQDYVQGSYDLPAPGADETLVAVKIIDMLGEEVVHTENV